MEFDNKRILQKCVIDPIIIIILALPLCVLEWGDVISPTMRKIFCNDESISYLFISSTYPSWILHVFAVFLPLIQILITNCTRRWIFINQMWKNKNTILVVEDILLSDELFLWFGCYKFNNDDNEIYHWKTKTTFS